MPSSAFFRALLLGAGVTLIAVLAYFAIRGGGEEPHPDAGFDPSRFVGERPKLDAPYVASDMEVVDAMLGLARVRPDDYVIDLGSGDGRILIAAARSLGAHGLGVDIDPARIRESQANARAAGVTGLVTFRQQDLFETPLGEADVVTLYLSTEINRRLRSRILAETRPGTRLVSHDFDMGEWRWDERRRIGTSTVYLWTVPAHIEGNWTLTLDGRTLPLMLDQAFQVFTGRIGDVRVEQGRITGDRIRFLADLGEGRRLFEGRVSGDTMTPVNPRANWRAVRAAR